MARAIIVGSGVVGTATGKGLNSHGHSVTFVDTNVERVDTLWREGLAATDTIDLSGAPAFIFLTLPTPNVGNDYDLSAFRAGVESVGRALQGATAYHTIVTRSTVPPGTCDDVVRPLLEASSGRRAGEHFGLAANPEFLRAACALEDVLHPWMTVVGSRSKRTAELLLELYEPYGGEFRTFASPVEAELVKCAHNLFNATKISFWNEMWLVCNRLGVAADPIAATVARSAEGSINIDYGTKTGMPFGGVCLPKDTRGFLGYAEGIGLTMPLLGAVVRTNELVEQASITALSTLFDRQSSSDVLDLRNGYPFATSTGDGSDNHVPAIDATSDGE